VEIEPEGGRRHNSPLKVLPPPKGKAAEGPPRRKAEKLSYLLQLFLLRKRNEALRKTESQENKSEPSELSSHSSVSVLLKGVTIYRRPPGIIIQLNYTFSVPDNRLYTFYKGITVTPRVVQASSVSSHGQTAFTRCAPCLCFVRRPFIRLLWPRVMAPSRRSQGPPLTPRLRRRTDP
jgi:hypothetical protein